MSFRSVVLVGACFVALAACGSSTASSPEAPRSSAAGTRRALVVGINDYESARGGHAAPNGRGVRNLYGAAGDARRVGAMLVEKFGFPREQVVLLIDGAATRAAILENFESHLIAPSRPGDVVVFYFSGHGSQRRNSLSEESDQLDETLVPADAVLGAADIRDKEMQRLLNRAIDRGAVPTVIFDSCHSGSAARGLPSGAEPRALNPVLQDIRDGGPFGPDPAERGALVISASRADEPAWETFDDESDVHGAFSWALLRALREVLPEEPAVVTFQRARALLHAATRLQEPVLEGNETARRTPLFAPVTRHDAGGDSDRQVVAVERIENDGRIVLQAGWAHGLDLGTRLTFRAAGGEAQEYEIVEIEGVGRSRARPVVVRSAEPGKGTPPRPGQLLELQGWTAPAGRDLAVWISTWVGKPAALHAFAAELAKGAAEREIEWVQDPMGGSPTHTLRWRDGHWELVEPGAPPLQFELPATSRQVFHTVPKGARFFLQLPAPAAWVTGFDIGPGTPNDGIAPRREPTAATLVLAGRWSTAGAEYAWLRPDTAAKTPEGLPLATPWRGAAPEEAATLLRDDLFHLRKLHGWLVLESPSQGQFGYQLGLQRASDGQILKAGGVLLQDELYHLTLTQHPGFDAQRLRARHLYVFLLDASGASTLLFGMKHDRNWQPSELINPATDLRQAPDAVPLGTEPLVRVIPPFGRDDYFLLTSDEPLANPWVLQYPGYRSRGPAGTSALEELLSLTGGTRSAARNLVTPAGWSIERLRFESVP